MSVLGVHITVCIVFALLCLLVFLIEKKKISEKPLLMLAITISVFLMNSPAMMNNLHIIGDNQYNTVIISTDEHGSKHFILNGSPSSMLYSDGRRGGYIAFVEEHFITPIMTGSTPPKSILVIGAGGFTLGLDDKKNDYTYVDIDPQLKELSEKYFIKKQLEPNKRFIPEDVRAYLNHTGKQFDFILVDVFFGESTIPEHLVTQEFFRQVRAVVNDNGIVTFNFILSPGFHGRLSQNLDNTLKSVFHHLDRQLIPSLVKPYDGWSTSENDRQNVLYIWYNNPDDSIHTVYTADKNAVSDPGATTRPHGLPTETRH